MAQVGTDLRGDMARLGSDLRGEIVLLGSDIRLDRGKGSKGPWVRE